MKIVLVSSEVWPFSKTGGLADVAGSLPKSLSKRGNQVFVVTPLYRETKGMSSRIKKTSKTFAVKIAGKKVTGSVWEAKLGKNVKVYLLENNKYFDRDGLYGNEKSDWSDNLERFTFLSKASLELCKTLNLKPDILHCHDWQTALVPTYLKTAYKKDKYFKNTSCVFTIHNLSYQGIFHADEWNTTDLDKSYFTPEYLEFYGKMNLMKGGIIFSDSITTVSAKYAQEIQTPKFGCGLEGLLSNYKFKINGILNGADYEEWDPVKDPFVIANFSKRSLAGKAACKSFLQKRFNLPSKQKTPLFGMVSRLVEQKGFDLLCESLDEIMKLNVQLVILGTGDPSLHDELKKYKEKYPVQLGLELGYDNKLAHQIEAGADAWLMPSRFEPCGLNQMYSLKYGTIPVVTPVGGLDDTIKNYNPTKKDGNGFKTKDVSKTSLLESIKTAVETYKDKKRWNALVKKAMGYNYSWDYAAEQYQKLFDIIAKNDTSKNASTLKNKTIIEIIPQKDLEA